MKKNLLYFLLGIFITACTGDSTMEVKEKQITVETDMEKQTEVIENNELQDIILTQNLVLENLIGFLSEQGLNEENNQILKSLAKFETIFRQVNCSGSETTVTESDNALVFEGGSNCAFSEELYHKLKQEIFLAREQITQLN
jgi:hypothetical protein